MTETSRAKSWLEPGRQPYTIRKAIEKIKDEVNIPELLREYDVEVRRNRARCIVHEGDNPTSFEIRPDRKWRCHACGEFGDIVDLCTLVEKHADTWTAVVSLSQQFDVELPRRPETWRKWSGEKYTIRDGVQKHLAAVYQRR